MKKKKQSLIQTITAGFKEKYDNEGADEFTEIFHTLLKKDLKLALWAMGLLYKIDSCRADCFEKLQEKTGCVCDCNDETFTVTF
jgi:hypothetical protein